MKTDLSHNNDTAVEKIKLFGIGITNVTYEEVLEYILDNLKKRHSSFYIVTPNPEILVYAVKHQGFAAILNNARISLPDGMGVILSGLILGKRFKERITGVDFMETLCSAVSQHNLGSSEKPITIGLLGGGPQVAEKTAECLTRRYPGLRVGFTGDDSDKLLRSLRSPMIDVLFVAFGFPKQEEWMEAHNGKIPVKVMMGVGGAFDYISGNVKRAPFVIRLFGFEWLWRLIKQPWRIRRQAALLQFGFMVIKERLHMG